MSRSTSDLEDLLERVDCLLCRRPTRYSVLRRACYPEGVTSERLLAAYSASSHQTLLDQLVKCDECSLVYLNPRLSGRLIEEGYAGAVDPTFVSQDEARIRTFRRALRRLCARLRLTPSRSVRVLDVGCAGGAFPKAAHDEGFSVTGVEPSAWLAAEGRRRYDLDIRAGYLEEQGLPEASFEVVTLWDVIEHLTRPARVLQEVRRLLTPDGLLVVNFPDLDGLVRRALGWRWPFFLSVHLTYFTRATLTRLLEQEGFEVQYVEPFWQTLQLAYVLERVERSFPRAGLVRGIVRRLGAERLPITYNMSQSLLVARRRP